MIVAESVSKNFGPVRAVDDLTFEIAGGEVVGLLGLNGAGKTTTLRMLSGTVLPTSGSISIDGVDLATDPEAIRSRIGFLPERPPIYAEMTVDEYLQFVAHIKGLRKDVGKFIDRAVESTHLGDVRGRLVGTLSHGYQRRLGIAQAVVHRPKLILLDEPTVGLDPVQIVHMRELIRELGSDHTVLVSSHILSEVGQVCDRVLVLRQGKLVAQGAGDELASRVSSNMMVRVAVDGDEAAAKKALSAVSEVVSVSPRASSGTTHEFDVELSSDVRSALARAVVEADLGLLQLERTKQELESVFLELTAAGEDQQTESAA
jgi:ABC-2 type transport system ATP-binding protein